MRKEQLKELLRIVLATEPTEIDCDEFLARVGACLEAIGPDERIPDDFRVVSQHLEVCPECKEEFDALLKLHSAEE